MYNFNKVKPYNKIKKQKLAKWISSDIKWIFIEKWNDIIIVRFLIRLNPIKKTANESCKVNFFRYKMYFIEKWNDIQKFSN